MKIENGPQNIISLLDTLQKKGAAPVGKTAQAQPQQTGDAFSVQLSAAVEQMKSPLEDDEIRRQKVEAIRNQLASGTYNISGKDVADKILNALKG